MKTIKKISIVLIALAAVCFTSCASTQFEQTEFEKQTGIMLIVPMRVFTWVKADGAKTFMKDYSSGKITVQAVEPANGELFGDIILKYKNKCAIIILLLLSSLTVIIRPLTAHCIMEQTVFMPIFMPVSRADGLIIKAM